MELHLVHPPGANRFMGELLEALAAELPGARVVERFGTPREDVRWAWIPHEVLGTLPPAEHPSAAHLARTVAIHTEQPGTVWSETAIDAARACGAVMDLSAVGMVELRRAGLAPELLQLGYTPRWDAWGGDPAAERPVDVTVLTALNRRKEVHLARALPWLEPWETELRCSLPRPKPVEGPRYLGGRAKHELLARSKVLLGVRTVRPPYFEWVRALEAICNGTVYLCEQGAGQAPLVAGSHVVMAAPEALGPVADALLRDPERLAAIRTAAYELVRAELPMRAGAERLQDVAFALAPVRTASSDASTAPNPSRGAGDRTVDSPLDVLPGPRLPDFEDPAMAPPPGVLPDEDALRVTLRERTLELREARREIARLTLRARGEDPDALDVTTSPDSAGHLPRVSVLLPLYDLAEHVEEALRSVAAQTLEDLELVVCDDASTDGSADVAARVLADLGRPFTLLRRRVNAGLPATRNLLLEHARAPYALPLDADNALFPRAAARLAAALDADPTAAFAYGPIAMERDGEPAGLLSALDWEPGDLRTCNWIDAMALLRVDAVRALGGYVTDDGLHGWEDYDLWCAVAEAGGNGAFVPQPVGRYRRSGGSMLSLSDLDQDGMRARLAARHPGLFADTAESLG